MTDSAVPMNRFRCHDHIVPCQHIRGYYRSTAISQEERLHLAVRQYVPLNNQTPRHGDVTIIACHAAGFFKELYEPFFDDIQREASFSGYNIRGIWIADIATHGASSTLNEGKLGNEPSWDDHARDLLYMINTFRDQMPMPLVGIGHSMGGTNILQLALLHPRLFTSVICIEPIVNKQLRGMNFAPAYWLSYRKDVWPSRQAAVAESKKGTLQRSWEQRVLDKWATHGFRTLPTLLHPQLPTGAQPGEAVTFLTTKHHDVRSFARIAFRSLEEAPETFIRDPAQHADLSTADATSLEGPLYRPEALTTFEKLQYLLPSCFYLYGSKSNFSSSSSQGRADKLNITGTGRGGSGGFHAGKVKEKVLQGGGHFMIFENPSLVAKEANLWIQSALQKWKLEDDRNREKWDLIGVREKAMVDDIWLYWVKRAYNVKRLAAPAKATKPLSLPKGEKARL